MEKMNRSTTLSYNDKLDALIQGLAELTEKVDILTEQNEELIEKISNINTGGSGYDVDDYES